MSRHASYTPNYFSIPDIFATQEKIMCKFQVKAKQLGVLDRGSTNPDIERGAVIELPYWMASSFFLSTVTIATITIPSAYSEAQRDILSADEGVIDLHNQFFYELGMCLSRLPTGDSKEISAMLLQAFRARFRLIMDWAMHSIIDTPGVRRLDQSEERIYYSGKEAALRLSHWLAEGDDLIEAGEMVISHRKRQSGMLEIRLDV